MKKCTLFIISMLAYCTIYAANENKQVLVFRHSGEVNLFYAEELDSIFCSYMDTAGVEYDSIVSQVFYTHDSAYIIPIEEIDSVVFGNRNEIEYKSDVRVLKSEDVSWIIRVEDYTVFFKPNTPASILPKVGEKLFYPEVNEMLPYGLSVKVVSVTPYNEEIAVTVEVIDLAEIFERFFYAGKVEDGPNNIASIQNKTSGFNLNLVGTLEVGSIGSCRTYGGLDISGDYVISPLKHYYHADLTLRTQIGFDIKLSASAGMTTPYKKEIAKRSLPPVCGVFIPSLVFNLFCDVNAELQFTYEMQRTYAYRILWTRKDGVNTIEYPSVGNNDVESEHAKIDITLDGNLFYGTEFDYNFCLIGDLIGAQASVKIGPEYSGHISVGILRDLTSSKFNPDLYASGEIGTALKASFRAYIIGREHNIWGDVVRKGELFAGYDRYFAQRTLHLFPEFHSNKAVKEARKSKPITISTTAKSNTNIIRPVETGFQVMDKKDEVLSTEFIKPLKEETEEMQGVAAVMEVGNHADKNDTLYTRPVFKYANYVIPYAHISASQVPGTMPIITYMTGEGVTVNAGASSIGQVGNDTTTMHIGNYLPVPAIDKFFVVVNPYASTVEISDAGTEVIIGTWKGIMDSISTTITFNDDATGTLEQTEKNHFVYQLNTPSNGKIQLTFGNSTTRVFSIKSLSALYISLVDEQTRDRIKFTRKNSNS